MSLLWHACSPPNRCSGSKPRRASARARAGPAHCSDTSRGRSVGEPSQSAIPTSAGSTQRPRRGSPAFALVTARTTVMRASHHALESRRRRGLQHRRPEVRLLPGVRTPDHQSGHQLLDNCRGIVPGTASRRSREGSVARSRRRPTHTCASRLTGRAPGSYPGTDWVRGPGRVPSRRSSVRWSAGPSSRRSRVRIPSVARSST